MRIEFVCTFAVIVDMYIKSVIGPLGPGYIIMYERVCEFSIVILVQTLWSSK